MALFKSPDNLAFRNATFGKLVVQQRGGVTARRTTICTRTAGQVPDYLQCTRFFKAGATNESTTNFAWDCYPDNSGSALPSPITLDQFTIEWWLDAESAPTNIFLDFNASNDDGTNQMELIWTGGSSPYLEIDCADATNDDFAYTHSPPGPTQQNHIAFQRDASKTGVLINGSLILETARVAGRVTIGNSSQGGFQVFMTPNGTDVNPYRLAQLHFSDVPRYPWGPFTPTRVIPIDAHTLYAFNFPEGIGDHTADQLHLAPMKMWTNTPPIDPTWLVYP